MPWWARAAKRRPRARGDSKRLADFPVVSERIDNSSETPTVLVADGPFAETKEAIGGYDVIECADLDEAIAVAAKHPVAAFGAIEVRPVWQ